MRVVFQFQHKLFHVSVIGARDDTLVAWGNYFIDADDESKAMSAGIDRFWSEHDDVLDESDSVIAQVNSVAETDGRFYDIVEQGHETNINGMVAPVTEIVCGVIQEAEEVGDDEADI